MKITIMTIIGVIAFFGALSLVSDYEPAEPHIIYTVDYPTLACPIEGGCDNLNHQ